MEDLGYTENNIHVESTVKRGKRTDIHCTDNYGNVKFVIEFKRPEVSDLDEHRDQLWNRYVKPLKADYGVLYNGLRLILYERIRDNIDLVWDEKVEDLDRQKTDRFRDLLRKPEIDITQIEEVSGYLDQFKGEAEKLDLETETSREHFFQNFRLERGSVFANLVERTVDLFEYQQESGKSKFLNSAYDFWEKSYAKKPDKVPQNWKPIMEDSQLGGSSQDLFKFMFCLETAYAFFMRTVLAKSCEDYGFPDVSVTGFVKTEIKRASFRGDIPLPAWAKMVHDLIKDMQRKLVSSVFEEDIFYWWSDLLEGKDYEDLFKKELEREALFGEAVARIVFILSKFDFSRIKGDPLGILYQKYFDKETRKALGEFYTPQEVVDYILDAVDYKGVKVLEKRLLDPACGSGTFLVTALQRYLEASERRSSERGWDWVLTNLCNKYRIVGFDVHPFATIMAQIQFMLVLLPYYKKALEDDPRFVLQRVPIFRTDSLEDETKSENLPLVASGERIGMRVELPVQGEKEGFFEESFDMPRLQLTLSETDLHNNEEYFGALQGLFDVVKEQAKGLQDSGEVPTFDKNKFETTLKRHYLSNKNWTELSDFFAPFARGLLDRIHQLQSEFDDGRLIKSIEDIFLAALLKNEQKYDYVVGNPPWGGLLLGSRGALPTDEVRSLFRKEYDSAFGKFDIYVLFIERAINWLKENGSLSYITQNRFMKRKYGEKIREKLLDQTQLESIIDFGDTSIFKDATNYPAIFKAIKTPSGPEGNIDYVEVDPKASKLSSPEVLNKIVQKDKKFVSRYEILQAELSNDTWSPSAILGKDIVEKIEKRADLKMENLGDVTQGCTIGGSEGEEIFLVSREEASENNLEKGLLRPVLKGRHINRWLIEGSGKLLIYPYKETDEEDIKPVNLDNYPNFERYIRQFEGVLKSRELDGKLITEWSKKWFELWRPRDPRILSSNKIVAPRLSTENTFAYDEKQNFLLDSAVAISFSGNDRKIHYLLGLLNSSLIQFFINSRSTFVQNRYYNYSQGVLYSIPLIGFEKSSEELKEKLINLVSKIKAIKDREGSISKFPAEYIGDVVEKYAAKITFESSHSGIAPRINERSDGSYEVVVGTRKEESPITVDTSEKAVLVKKYLDGKNVKRGEEVEILIPRSNAVVKEILEEYEKDKNKLEQLPQIKKIEDRIDQIVYRLYGLDKEDIEMVEEFLRKF